MGCGTFNIKHRFVDAEVVGDVAANGARTIKCAITRFAR